MSIEPAQADVPSAKKAAKLFTRARKRNTIHDWYEVTAEYRLLIDTVDEEKRGWKEMLRRFVISRIELAAIHEELGECVRAATVLDEAIGRLMPHVVSLGDATAEGVTLGDLDRLFIEALITRAEVLTHVHRAAAATAEARDAARLLDVAWPDDFVHRQRGRVSFFLGHLFANDGECRAAAEYYERAVDSLAAAGDETNAVIARLKRAIELTHCGEWKKALEVFEPIISSDIGDDALAVKALEAWGNTLEREERCAEAADAYGRGAESCQPYLEDVAEARLQAAALLRSRASSLLHVHRFDEADESLVRALSLNVDTAKTLQTRSELYESWGRIADAAACAAETVEILRNEHDSHALAGALTSASRLADMAGDGEAALTMADEALAICGQDGTHHNLAMTHEARGEALLTLQQCGDSRADLRKAADHWQDDGALLEAARLLGRLAWVEAHMNNAAGAMKAHQEQIALLKRLGTAEARDRIAVAQFERGRSLAALNENAAAEATFRAAADAAKDASDPTQAEVYECLAVWTIENKDARSAVEWFNLLTDVYERLLEQSRRGAPEAIVTIAVNQLGALADAGEIACAARLAAAALEYGRDTGADFDEFTAACRRLSSAQLRAMGQATPEQAAALRMLVGKGGV